MVAFSVLTPYYDEDVMFSTKQLKQENEDGVSILYYLQKIYPGIINCASSLITNNRGSRERNRIIPSK